jgi:hypothetical protein
MRGVRFIEMHDFLILLLGAVVGLFSSITTTWVSNKLSKNAENRKLQNEAHRSLSRFAASYLLDSGNSKQNEQHEAFKVLREGIDLNKNNPGNLSYIIGTFEQAMIERDNLLAKLKKLEEERSELIKKAYCLQNRSKDA